jgi:hypothetical protein
MHGMDNFKKKIQFWLPSYLGNEMQADYKTTCY